MDYTLTIGGVDCADKVVSIHRNHSLCNATATADVELDPTWNQAFNPYDEVVIHEEGTKVFTGLVTPIQKQRMGPLRTVMAQCPTKRLQDWWYAEEIGSAGSSPAQMLGKLCDDAGVNYSLNSTTDETLPIGDDEITWQYTSAWDIMEELLTMMGWQLIPDADGVLQIGEVATVGSPDHTFQEGVNLISVSRRRDDSYYRNAIAIYGTDVSVKKSKVALGEMERAGAFANPLIRTKTLARNLIDRALYEFSQNLDVKTCHVIGDASIKLGNTARVIESFTELDVNCLVTTVRSSMDANGYAAEVVLDERCSVIWGHDTKPKLLYAATAGSGVYRSEDYGETWEAANGVTAGSILSGNVNAIEANYLDPEDVWAATDDGLFRTLNGGQISWAHQDVGDLALTSGSIVSSGSVIWHSVDQDELQSDGVYYFMGADPNMQEAWVVKFSGGSFSNNWHVAWW